MTHKLPSEQIFDLKEELNSASKVIAEFSEALEKIAIGSASFTIEEMSSIAFFELSYRSAEIEKARGRLCSG